jgi:hypothetical protein
MENSFCQAASQIPSSSHIRSRRQQVEPSGYCSGRSRHLAPIRRAHCIPSRQDRFDTKVDLVRACAASAREIKGTTLSTVLRSRQLTASFASWQKVNKPPVSNVCTCSEAEPIPERYIS